MSKVSFRARQIDFNKPLPIVKNGSDLFAEFSENALVNRGVPQIPSGMEKEEENEHHFVEVIHALQLRTNADVKIPVPDIIDKNSSYEKIYPNGFSLPKQLVHIRTVVLADNEPVEYDMDTDDEEWLKKSDLPLSPDRFEMMIDRLERGCGQKVMNLEEANCLLQDDPSLVIAVYDYWLNKRVQARQPLLLSVRQEKRDGGSNGDPYVAFRRRSEKMQTRKNRKNDEQSYEKMVILRDQMDTLGEILSRLVKREAIKEALVECDCRCFNLRYKMNDWDGILLTDAEIAAQNVRDTSSCTDFSGLKEQVQKRGSRKRKLTRRALNLSNRTNSSEDMSDMEHFDESQMDETYAFVRMPGCRYLKPRGLYSTAFERTEVNEGFSPHRYTLSSVVSVCHPKRHRYTGYIRRRLGRGGRVICDRIAGPEGLDSMFCAYDSKYQSALNTCSAESLDAIPAKNWQKRMAKDEALIHRLNVLLRTAYRGRPSYKWPVCTAFSVPTFEPLSPNPWSINHDITTTSSLQSVTTLSTEKLSPASHQNTFNPTTTGCLGKTDLQQNGVDDAACGDSNRLSRTKQSTVSMPPFSDANVAEGCQPNLSVSAVRVPNHSLRYWAKPYGAFDALKPTELPKSRDAESAALGGSNGLDRQMMRSSEDRLPSSKIRCLTHDCVPRDAKVTGSQLQAANGVNPPQFYQLPT